MRDFSPRQRVLEALLGGKPDRPPVTCIAGPGGAVTTAMQQATGIFWPDAHRDAEKMAALAIAACELGKIECVKVPFDNVVEAEALGCRIRYPEKIDLFPVSTHRECDKPADMKRPEKFLSSGRIPVVLEAIRAARQRAGDFLPIASHVAGPFTLVCALVGLQRFSAWSIKNFDFIEPALNYAAEITIEYAKAQYRAGSDVVAVADGGLGPNIVTPRVLHECIKPVLAKIAAALKGIRVLYIGGQKESMVSFLAECGYDGISIDETVSVQITKRMVGKVKILGNISSNRTLIFGSPAAVKSEVKQAIEQGVDLIEPSYGYPPNTPMFNIHAMVEAVREYRIGGGHPEA